MLYFHIICYVKMLKTQTIVISYCVHSKECTSFGLKVHLVHARLLVVNIIYIFGNI